jgi:hypothetical protein
MAYAPMHNPEPNSAQSPAYQHADQACMKLCVSLPGIGVLAYLTGGLCHGPPAVGFTPLSYVCQPVRVPPPPLVTLKDLVFNVPAWSSRSKT